MRSILLNSLVLGLLFSSCSVPNLESEDCIEARASLKKLYSLHFDKGFARPPEYLEKRSEFLSERFRSEADTAGPGGFDALTQTSDYPKAFRIGKCSEGSGTRVYFGILLFWRDDERNEQRTIEAEMIKTGEGWKLERVNASE